MKTKTKNEVIDFFKNKIRITDCDCVFADLFDITKSVPETRRLINDWYQMGKARRWTVAQRRTWIDKFVTESLARATGYAWVIDWDYAAEDGADLDHRGMSGPAEGSLAMLKKIRAVCGGKQFRLLDARNNLVLEGRIIGDFTGDEPIDDIGVTCGATKIHYLNDNHEWESTNG